MIIKALGSPLGRAKGFNYWEGKKSPNIHLTDSKTQKPKILPHPTAPIKNEKTNNNSRREWIIPILKLPPQHRTNYNTENIQL